MYHYHLWGALPPTILLLNFHKYMDWRHSLTLQQDIDLYNRYLKSFNAKVTQIENCYVVEFDSEEDFIVFKLRFS